MAGTTTNGVTTYPVEVQIDNPDEDLLPGMNVSTEIVVSQADDVIAIPVGAVTRGNMVLVKQELTVRKIRQFRKDMNMLRLETGISNDSYVEIKSGINEGDEIAYIFSSSSDMFYGGAMMAMG